MAYANPSNRSGAPRRDNDGWQHPTSPPLDTSGIDLCPPPGQSLNPDLFDGIARRVAKAISDADRYRNKPSQLRQFYDELGLHIGSGNTEMHIGGTDNPVIKNPITRSPISPAPASRARCAACWNGGPASLHSPTASPSVSSPYR
jgi:hypothetical protein